MNAKALIDERVAKIVVIGQGYVGLPVAMRAVAAGFDVVGYDASSERVKSLQAGTSYVGVDIGPRDFREPRVTTVVGDQTDRAFLRSLVADHGPFDVVIDDGSHISAHIITSFQTVFPLMPSGGLYVIEDLQYSYDPEFGGGPPGTPQTSVEMLKTLIDSPTQGGDVASVHVYPKIAFIERR